MSLFIQSVRAAAFASSIAQVARRYSVLSDPAIPEAKRKFIPTSGTYPKGFLVSGTHVGIKSSNTEYPDLALIVSETPCSAAAVFTTNRFQAAPVQVSKEVLEKSEGSALHSVIINAGCANAVTGKGGLEDAHKMSEMVDECIGSKERRTLVMSTGVIGQRLPIEKILNKIPTAYSSVASTHESWLTAARAICTTDTFPKLISQSFTLPSAPGRTYHLAGMAKGAGMIHPNMATLLGVICTDAPVTAGALKGLLPHAISRSFNSISVDGDTSTNDTIALLANGAAGGPRISSDLSEDYVAFREILTKFSQSLAHLVVRDGEGATKFVTIRVQNSPCYDSAQRIASTIARSPLVKTALYGRDANWGRILCAIGYADGLTPGTIVAERVSVKFRPINGSADLDLLINGEPAQVDEERAAEILQDEDLEIIVDLGGGEQGATGLGGKEAVYWFCDFSHEYITINGSYRT